MVSSKRSDKTRRYIGILVLVLLSESVWARQYEVTGVDSFSAQEQRKLLRWLDKGETAMHQLFGPLPFTTYIHLYQRQGREPVPWAHTWKAARKSLHLYIDTDYSHTDFINDWTLYHEWSHLLMPYLGEQHRWWAEGFASYMQYHLMAQAGVLQGKPTARIRQRWQQYRHYFTPDEPLGSQAQRLISQGRYPPAYWAGAQYFVRVQAQLPEGDLIRIVAEYNQKHYSAKHSLLALLAVLDQLAGQAVFSQTYTAMMRNSYQLN